MLALVFQASHNHRALGPTTTKEQMAERRLTMSSARELWRRFIKAQPVGEEDVGAPSESLNEEGLLMLVETCLVLATEHVTEGKYPCEGVGRRLSESLRVLYSLGDALDEPSHREALARKLHEAFKNQEGGCGSVSQSIFVSVMQGFLLELGEPLSLAAISTPTRATYIRSQEPEAMSWGTA